MVYLASILLSQAAYESNYGSSLLSVKYHNIYSLPARPGQEHIYLKDNVYSKGKWQYQKVDFAVFRDWSSSMIILSRRTTPRYDGENRPIKRWQELRVIKLRQKSYKLQVLVVILITLNISYSIIETYNLVKI